MRRTCRAFKHCTHLTDQIVIAVDQNTKRHAGLRFWMLQYAVWAMCPDSWRPSEAPMLSLVAAGILGWTYWTWTHACQDTLVKKSIRTTMSSHKMVRESKQGAK